MKSSSRPPRIPSRLSGLIHRRLNCYALAIWIACVLATLLVIAGNGLAENGFRVIHYFANKPAQYPYAALVEDSAGNFYGTTVNSKADKCGTLGCGTVFKLARGSSGEWKYSVIHRFIWGVTDGSNPWGSLILDGTGNLYGTTANGGTFGLGTVFEISPVGDGWSEKILSSFGRPPDVSVPFGALIFDESGNLYGTGSTGGVNNGGGVFQLRASGGNGWKESVIYGFTCGNDGCGPGDNLVRDAEGNLYGTAFSGGENDAGLVYELAPSSSGTWVETVLHSFTGRSDGRYPVDGLTADGTGNLYGVTAEGGRRRGFGGFGTVFELTPSNGTWTFSTLHSFHRRVIANAPLLFSPPATLYGTTVIGGPNKVGLVL